MPYINYIEHDGSEHQVDVASGATVMEGAVRNGVPGVDADCGGACACATCHVYIDDAWIEAVGEANDMELAMLDFAQDKRANSRLSCQIIVSNALDGLIVSIPKDQH